MMKAFSSTFFGQIIKVYYTLRVNIKHAGFCDFGDGDHTDFDITIHSTPPEGMPTNQPVFEAP